MIRKETILATLMIMGLSIHAQSQKEVILDDSLGLIWMEGLDQDLLNGLILSYPDLLGESGDWNQFQQEMPHGYRPDLSGYSISTVTHRIDHPIELPSMRSRGLLKKSGLWEFRYLVDQDSGEPIRQGPDHRSAALSICPSRGKTTIYIGDYHINTGYGLTQGSSGFMMSGLANPALLSRKGSGLRLHTGSDENRFLRGMAVETQWKRYELSVFVSGKRIDARMDTIWENDQMLPVILSLGTSGYHRSQKEILTKKILPEEIAGWSVIMKGSFSESGLAMMGLRYPYYWSNDLPWTDPIGDTLSSYVRMGVFHQRRIRFGILFGELSYVPSQGIAGTSGFRSFNFHGLTFAFRQLWVSEQFPVQYTWVGTGGAFTQPSRNLSGAFAYQFHGGWSLRFGLESKEDLSLKDKEMGSSVKIQLEADCRITSSALLRFSLRIRSDASEKLTPGALITTRVQFDSDPRRLSAVRIKGSLSTGWKHNHLFGWDVNFKSGHHMQFNGGFWLYGSGNGVDPLYGYEPDLRFQFMVPAFYGTGGRIFGLLKWIPLQNLQFEAKGWYDIKSNASDWTAGLRVQISFSF